MVCVDEELVLAVDEVVTVLALVAVDEDDVVAVLAVVAVELELVV